jgi:hypothetical protein
MSYKGTFISSKDEQYEVSFLTETASELPLEFGTSPFVVSYQGDDDIYKPLKLSGATVNIYTDSHKFDLYTGNVLGVKCIFKGYDKVLWQGYVTPCLYSQDAYENSFYLSVECVDALSVLENIKYTQISEQKSIYSFYEVINHCLKHSGYNLTIDNKSNIDLTDKYILEQNFFDEDGEAWSCKEVLEEVLSYCNLTMTLIGDIAYIVDWDYLVKYSSSSTEFIDGISSTTKYPISNKELSVVEIVESCLVALGLTYSIKLEVDDVMIDDSEFVYSDGSNWRCHKVLSYLSQKLDIAYVTNGDTLFIYDKTKAQNFLDIKDGLVFSGSTLSLSEVYNSIAINSDTYAMDSLVPAIGSDSTLITSAPTYFWGTLPDKYTEKIVTLKSDRIETSVFKYIGAGNAELVEPEKDASNWNTNFGAFYFRPTYWNYEESNEGEATSECVIGFKNVWVDKDCEPFSNNYNGQQTNTKNDKWGGLYWAYSDSQKIGSTTTVLTMKSDGDVVVGGGYTCIEAECWSNCGNIPAAVASGSTVVTEIKQKSTNDAIKLKCSIKIGDWHLIHSGRNNATTKQNLIWTKDVQSEEFPLELEIGELGDDIQKFEQWHSLRNCQIEGVDSVGYKAYIEDIIVGELEVKFCLPKMKTMTSGNGDKYKQYHWVLMKSFAVKNIAKEIYDDDYSGVTIGEEDNSDIVWSTVINDDYSIEGESIDLKLNTPSNRSYCYSDVFHSTNGETFTRLEAVDKGHGYYPMEQYKLNSYYWQNKEPRKVIDLVTNFVANPIGKYNTPYSDNYFIANSVVIDYGENKTTLQLIEKGEIL